MTPYTRLVLFDIDGTLLTTNGQAVSAMMEAYGRVFGVQPSHNGHLMDGKTELAIAHELLHGAGVAPEVVSARLPDFWSAYAEALQRHLRPEGITVYPGVRELLRQAGERPDYLVGLLTGNCEAAARIKLETAGLSGFRLGAFGQEHTQRTALPPLALEAARQAHGAQFSGRSVVIVGDTPNDILCARDLGARTIAVATGHYGRGALAEHRPDALFDDLSDVPAVLAAIDAD